MTFSPEWDREFREGRHLSRYPWSDLVSFVNRYTELQWGSRVLELGCGVGANYELFRTMCQYCGVDGSKEAIDRAIRVYAYPSRWKVTDFTEEIPFDGPFDLIFDRAAVTHNDTESIKRCIELVKQRLKPGGKYIGIDWFSPLHCGFTTWGKLVDEWTGMDYEDGPFKGIGKVHFSDKYHIRELFKDFEFEALEHKITFCKIPEYRLASWNFCCTLK